MNASKMLHLHLGRLMITLTKTLRCNQGETFVLGVWKTDRATLFTQCRTHSSNVVKVNVLEHTEYSHMKDKLAAEEKGGTIGPLGKVLKS